VPHTLRYSIGGNRIDITRDDGAKSSLWWATKNERPGLTDVTGPELEALHGASARKPLTGDSPEYMFITPRRFPDDIC
jgi:hypothetical protein